MRYLRMLSNSVFAGALAAVYLTLLVLHLNPAVPSGSATPVLTVMSVTYGVHIAVLSYVLYVFRHIAIGEPSTPGWISLRLLTWSAAVLSGAAAVITWLHATGLRRTLDPQAFPGIMEAALAWAAAAVLFLVLGIAQAIARDRSRATVAVLFSVVTISSIAAPLALRAEGATTPAARPPGEETADATEDTAARVILLCLDGASLDVISPAVAAGRLPNFSRILDRGASMHLATTRPTYPETAWASVLTGKWPAAHAVRAAARYQPYTGGPPLDVLPDYLFSQLLVRFRFVVELPHTSRSLRSWPLWAVVAEQRIRSGVIGLPLTYPAQPLPGFVISDALHRTAGRAAELRVEPTVYPATLEERARDVFGEGDAAEAALHADRAHQRLAQELAGDASVRVFAVRYSGIDAVGHYFAGFTQPDPFRASTDEERRALERRLHDYYAYIDSMVGDAIAMLRAGDLLFVVSAFGMEPMPLGKRVLERLVGDPRVTGSHERAPDGFALAYGEHVAAGRLPRGTVVDVVPTLLYFLGLPIGRDMDGFARTDVFTRAFNAPRTITFIPTYERE